MLDDDGDRVGFRIERGKELFVSDLPSPDRQASWTDGELRGQELREVGSRSLGLYIVIACSFVLGRAGLNPFRGAGGTAGAAERDRLERVQPGHDVLGLP